MQTSTHTASGARARRLAAWPMFGALALASTLVAAGPVNVFYLKDARATNTSPSSSASTSPNIFFSTPVLGLNQTSFAQVAETVSAIESQIAGSGSSTTTYQASIEAGRLRASSTSVTNGSYGGPIGTGLSTSAEQAMRVRDTLNATAGNLGSQLSLTLTLQLDSLLSVFNVPSGSNSALCGYGSVGMYADIGNARVAGLDRNLCAGGDNMTISAVFNVIDGQDFDLTLGMGILSQAAMGAGNTIGSSVGINAMNTGLAFLSGPTNYRLTSTSGYSYVAGGGGTVPEPATPALVLLALASLGLIRRRVL